MTMRILIFYRENIAYNIVNYLIDTMAKGLRNIGATVDIFDIYGDAAEAECDRLVQALNENHYDAAYTVDAAGQQNLRDRDDRNIFDSYQIPFFNRVLDPPYYLDLDSEGKNYYILFTDRDYIDFTKKYYPSVRDAFFLPHFSSTDFSGETKEEYLARRYPVCFTGTYESVEGMVERLVEPLPQPAKVIFFDALDILLDERETGVEDALLRVFKDHTGNELTVEQYRNIRLVFSNLNVFTRHYIREELLRILAMSDIPLHIWGEGDWESADWIKDSAFVFHGRCEAMQIPEIYRQSKVVLNCFPCFKGGSHDRLPAGMMNGAAVMTDRNKYTDSIENSGDKFIYYDISHPEKAPGILLDALNDTAKLYETAVRGRKYAAENMSAEHAANEFLKLVRKVKADQ